MRRPDLIMPSASAIKTSCVKKNGDILLFDSHTVKTNGFSGLTGEQGALGLLSGQDLDWNPPGTQEAGINSPRC